MKRVIRKGFTFMKVIKNVLKNELNIRTEKNFPIEGIEFIDITSLILQKETLKEITDKFVKFLKDKKIDYIVAPEARGFLFGTAVANELNVGFIPIRKKGKLPPTTVEMQFEYEKEYGKDVLELPKLVNDIIVIHCNSEVSLIFYKFLVEISFFVYEIFLNYFLQYLYFHLMF